MHGKLRRATAQSEPRIFGRNPLPITVFCTPQDVPADPEPRRCGFLFIVTGLFHARDRKSGKQIAVISLVHSGPLKQPAYDVLCFTHASAY